MDKTVEVALFRVGFGRGVAYEDEGAGQDFHVRRIAVEGARPALDSDVELLRSILAAQTREHHFGGFRSKLSARFGLPGLNIDRPTLHREGDVERPTYGKIAAFVVEFMQFRRIEVNAGLDIADECVVFQTVQKT